jgi:4-alpha-glucanotransferase
MGLSEDEGPIWGVMRQGMSSIATLFFAQLQDYLGLGGESRINTPGTQEGNWQWRLQEGQLTDELAQRIASVTQLYGRCD